MRTATPIMRYRGATFQMYHVRIVGDGLVEYTLIVRSKTPLQILSERTVEGLAKDYGLTGFKELERTVENSPKGAQQFSIRLVIHTISAELRAAFLAAFCIKSRYRPNR